MALVWQRKLPYTVTLVETDGDAHAENVRFSHVYFVSPDHGLTAKAVQAQVASLDCLDWSFWCTSARSAAEASSKATISRF